jgi:hypothetical protein
VQGLNSGSGNGLFAFAYNNDAINGTTVNPSYSRGGRSGVYGVDNSSDGGNGNAGVSGYSGNGTGVWGTSTTNSGVFGLSSEYGGWGVLATSQSSVSLAASPTSASEIQTIQAIGGTNSDALAHSLDASSSDYHEFELNVTNDNAVLVWGKLYTLGRCSSGCARSRGERVASYAAQSSAPILQDIGEGRLIAGQARVTIDASLGRMFDRQASYQVEVSAEGPSHGLYVADRSATSFRVVENDGGHSTIPFGYRIVATPRGARAIARLLSATSPHVPHAKRLEMPRRLPR